MKRLVVAIPLLALAGCTTINPCMKYEDPIERIKCENLQANPCLAYSDPQAQMNCQNTRALQDIARQLGQKKK